MAADEPGRTGDQADVVMRAIDPPTTHGRDLRRRGARRLRHVGGRRTASAQRRGCDVTHNAPILAGGPLAVGEHRIERVEEGQRLGLGERQRRQQLDDVVLAGRHRDHAVVAMKGDHDQLREQPFARHPHQAHPELRLTRAGRLQLDPDHQTGSADVADQLMTLLELPDPVEEQRAHTRRAGHQPIAINDPHRCQTRRHREAVTAERRLMHVAALERPDCPLIDLAPRDHRRNWHVAPAERLADQHGVRLELPPLQREPGAGAAKTGLDLVEDEQRAVAPAQDLCGFEIAGRRQCDQAPLDGLDDEGGYVLRAQLGLQAREVTERNARAPGQERAEPLLEELVAHDRERPERDPVEATVTRQQPWPPRRRASELDRRVDRLGPGAREEHRVEFRRQAS